jgi:DNA-directed RNA polymerase specialized sigma24 family protein
MIRTMTETVLNIKDAKIREEFFEEIYEQSFPAVAGFVAYHGGSLEDAKDTFHDALVILYEMIVSGKESVSQSYDAYLVGIAKHLWVRKFKKSIRNITLSSTESEIVIPEDYFDKKNNNLLTLLELTGRKCLDLLKAFYYDKISLDDISSSFGFSGVRSATVQKFKCIEKLREKVKEKHMTYDDLDQ